MIFNSDFKGVMQTEDYIRTYMSKSSDGRFLARVREEVLYSEMCGMSFPRHHYFFEMFHLKSQQLFAAGILKFEETRFQNRRYDKIRIESDGPKVLSLKMLEPRFVIWVSSLSLAFAAFVFEWLFALKEYLIAKFSTTSF